MGDEESGQFLKTAIECADLNGRIRWMEGRRNMRGGGPLGMGGEESLWFCRQFSFLTRGMQYLLWRGMERPMIVSVRANPDKGDPRPPLNTRIAGPRE